MSILKDKREAQGYTRETFCKTFGLIEGSVINWELGRSCPNWNMMQRIMEAYGIESDEDKLIKLLKLDLGTGIERAKEAGYSLTAITNALQTIAMGK